MLAISGIFTLAPAILSKWMLNGLSDRRTNLIEAFLKILAILVASGGIATFSVCFGGAMEQVDLFGSTAGGWRIPMWVMLGTAMMAECLTSVGIVSWISRDLRELFPAELVVSETYAKATEQLEKVNIRFAERAAEMSELEADLGAYNAARELLIENRVCQFRASQLQQEFELQAIEARRMSEAAAVKMRLLQTTK
jgi:hypothetical protein